MTVGDIRNNPEFTDDMEICLWLGAIDTEDMFMPLVLTPEDFRPNVIVCTVPGFACSVEAVWEGMCS